RRQTERGCAYMHERAGADAERGGDAGAQALRRAAADDVQRVRAGRDVEQQSRDDEKREVVGAEHQAAGLPRRSAIRFPSRISIPQTRPRSSVSTLTPSSSYSESRSAYSPSYSVR